MNKIFLLAGLTAATALTPAANAAVIGSLGGGTGTFATLTSAGLDGGAVATLVGGSVLTSDQPNADIPEGIFGGTFLATGPTAGQPATLAFTTPLSYLSFLWGSPDTYNLLTLVSDRGAYTFDVASLGFGVRNGDQDFSQYVQFNTTMGETIRSVTFTNVPAVDAFETANFNVTAAAVPEPATWAMMLVGFGMTGAAMRYRRRSAKIVYA